MEHVSFKAKIDHDVGLMARAKEPNIDLITNRKLISRFDPNRKEKLVRSKLNSNLIRNFQMHNVMNAGGSQFSRLVSLVKTNFQRLFM